MKMKITAFIAVLMLAGGLMVACSSSPEPENAEVSTDNFVGDWEFVYGSQEELSQETVQLAKSLGANAIMTLKDDGTGSFDLYGTVQSLTWSASSDTEGTLTLEGNEPAAMTVADGQLELKDTVGQTLTFVRYVPSDEGNYDSTTSEALDAAIDAAAAAVADASATSDDATTSTAPSSTAPSDANATTSNEAATSE